MRVVKLTKNQAMKDYDFAVEAKAYEDGVQVLPAAATITVYDPDGTAVVDGEDMGVDENGTMTYTVPAADLGELWENARIEIEYTEAA